MTKLDQLYDIHDNMEAALRAYEKGEMPKMKRLLWKAHDVLERVVIAEQARQGKV